MLIKEKLEELYSKSLQSIVRPDIRVGKLVKNWEGHINYIPADERNLVTYYSLVLSKVNYKALTNLLNSQANFLKMSASE